MMTNSDFEKFSTVIRDHLAQMDRLGLNEREKLLVNTFIESIAGDIADICDSSNNNFDYERFLKACGL